MQRATCGKIAAMIEAWAPPSWAEPWDNVGLLVGDPERTVERVLVALELTEGVAQESIRVQTNLTVVHHPPIFKPLKALRFDSAAGRRIEQMIRAGIGLYAAHTNLDQAPGATNDTLAAAVGLNEHEVLFKAGEERYLKLVVYVPWGYEDVIRDAIAQAGAGHIGNYSHCTFQALGTGTFLPLEGATPFVGQQGVLEYAKEFRLETILPEGFAGAVVQAMKRVHPYEEVAYDLYPLANAGRPRGHGRIGRLPQPVSMAALAAHLKQSLCLSGLRLVGNPERSVTTVAVGAGAGSMLISHAAHRGADLLITGDIGYHDAQDALDAGIGLIDIGHYHSEAIAVRSVAAYLRQRLAESELAVEVVEAAAGQDPFQFM